MIKIIIGKKGTGKTKALIEMVNASVQNENGDVVCIEHGEKLTYDISHQARLIDINQYHVSDFNTLEGFVGGLMAGNFDISSIYVDSILKIGGEDLDKLGDFLNNVEVLSEKHNVNFVAMVSADADLAPESVKKFIK